MRIAIAQLNPTVGALDDNATQILEAAQYAEEDGADLLVFPVHSLTGWPLKGLECHEPFLEDARRHLNHIAKNTAVPVVLTCPTTIEAEGVSMCGEEVFILDGNGIHSLGIPDYDLDDSIGIDTGSDSITFAIDRDFNEFDEIEGCTALIELRAVSMEDRMAAPVALCKPERLENLARENNCFAAYVNLAGGADNVVFTGNSYVVGPTGDVLAAGGISTQELIIFDTDPATIEEIPPKRAFAMEEPSVMWEIIVAGTRDYIVKNNFKGVVIGLSGGIDSAVCATIAVDAIGAENVHGVLMPSEYSSEGSVADSLKLAENLGISTEIIPINEPVEAFHKVLADACGGEVSGLAAENLQARIRSVYLMTISNAKGWMVLNTGNKSEAAMGFSTLYGDTCGAFAPLGESYKTQVYELAKWRAAQSPSIPMESITKPPSAELYPGAVDADRLPEYSELDAVLACHIEGGMGAAQLKEQGFSSELINRVLPTVQRNEYKRRFEPFGPKIFYTSFNEDRDWPVTNGWRDPGLG